MASADKPMKQNTLEGFTKKVESSPKVQRVQSGPIRYAGATNVRHSPISRPDGGGGSKGGARHQKLAAEQVPSSSTPVADNPKTPTVTGGLKRLFYSEVQGDLFSCPDSASLVHCVSEDMHMGKGIATLFKQKFGGVKELKAQGVKTGGLAVLKRGDRFIYYLVTKACYFHKPTYRTLQASLEALCSHCVSNGVRELCMPCIGCGLDRLQWGRVSDMIQKVFADVDISITVYFFK